MKAEHWLFVTVSIDRARAALGDFWINPEEDQQRAEAFGTVWCGLEKSARLIGNGEKTLLLVQERDGLERNLLRLAQYYRAANCLVQACVGSDLLGQMRDEAGSLLRDVEEVFRHCRTRMYPELWAAAGNGSLWIVDLLEEVGRFLPSGVSSEQFYQTHGGAKWDRLLG